MFRSVSILRLHDFIEYPQLVIDSIARHVDGILFVVSDRTVPELLELPNRCPQTIEVVRDNEPWSNGPSLDRAFRFVDRLQPETVLYTDHDEVLPERYPDCLEQWRRSGRPMAAFQFVFTWGDPDTIVNRRVKCWWHAKLVKWQPGIRFVPYRGCCLPVNWGIRQACRVAYPLRHLCFTTKAMRDKRLSCRRRRRHDRAWIEAASNPTIPYDPDMTWAEWAAQAAPALG